MKSCTVWGGEMSCETWLKITSLLLTQPSCGAVGRNQSATGQSYWFMVTGLTRVCSGWTHDTPCQADVFASSSNTSETSVWLLTWLFCFLLSKKKRPLKGSSSWIITCSLTTARAFSSLLLISQQLKVHQPLWNLHNNKMKKGFLAVISKKQWNKQNSCEDTKH